MLLIEYDKQWYRTEHEGLSHWAMSHFNMVIKTDETYKEFNVLKNRYTGETGIEEGITDLMRVQMWTEGKTIKDLPLFIDDHLPGKGPYGFREDVDGNLRARLLADQEARN